MSARELAAQTLRSYDIGWADGEKLVQVAAQEAAAHGCPGFELGYLRATVRRLAAELAIARLDGLTEHEKALRLVRDARDLVFGWLEHPVAGDEAGGVHDVHDVLGEALVGLEATFFEQPAAEVEEDMPDPEWQAEARAQRAQLEVVRGAA